MRALDLTCCHSKVQFVMIDCILFRSIYIYIYVSKTNFIPTRSRNGRRLLFSGLNKQMEYKTTPVITGDSLDKNSYYSWAPAYDEPKPLSTQAQRNNF